MRAMACFTRTVGAARCSMVIPRAKASCSSSSLGIGSATASTSLSPSSASGTTERCAAISGGTSARTRSTATGSSPAGAAARRIDSARSPVSTASSMRATSSRLVTEIAPVDDLAGERLLDLPHGRDLALDDEGAQGHGRGGDVL